jgi:DNA-binding response OmpR family regulator
MKILLVDENKDVLETIGEILEICQNHEVQAANSAKEALRLVRKKKHDLVVLDLALKVMNGLQLIPKIRKIHPKLDIVVLTSINCNDAIRKKLSDHGVEKIFQKPKGIHELLAYVKKLQAKHSAA